MVEIPGRLSFLGCKSLGDSNPKSFASVCHWHSGVIMGDQLIMPKYTECSFGWKTLVSSSSIPFDIGFLCADSSVFLVLAEDERSLCLFGAEDLPHCCGFFQSVLLRTFAPTNCKWSYNSTYITSVTYFYFRAILKGSQKLHF